VLPATPGAGRSASFWMRGSPLCAETVHVAGQNSANLALTDELTGLYNRAASWPWQNANETWAATGRGMLLFIDGRGWLKQINDSFGHLEGDRGAKAYRKGS